jgi:hypothetical protein
MLHTITLTRASRSVNVCHSTKVAGALFYLLSELLATPVDDAHDHRRGGTMRRGTKIVLMGG